jgi:hypothetical protein
MTTRDELIQKMWEAYRPVSSCKSPALHEQFNAMACEAINQFKHPDERKEFIEHLWDAAMHAVNQTDTWDSEVARNVQDGMQRIASAAMEYLLLVPRSRLDK